MPKSITIKTFNDFKGGKESLKTEYTNRWVELINLLEKSKEGSSPWKTP